MIVCRRGTSEDIISIKLAINKFAIEQTSVFPIKLACRFFDTATVTSLDGNPMITFVSTIATLFVCGWLCISAFGVGWLQTTIGKLSNELLLLEGSHEGCV